VEEGCDQVEVHPTLEEKEEEQENRFFLASIAPGTLTLYSRKWKEFQEFCLQRKVSLIPTENSVKSYILALADKEKVSLSGIDVSLAAIGFFCSKNLYTNPIPSSSRLNRLVKGIRNAHCVPVNQKTPLTPSDLKKMFDLHFSDPDNLCFLRVIVISALCFSLCLRQSEAANLNSDNIQKIGGKFKLSIMRSKNQKRGFVKYVNVDFKNKYCTGSLLSKYLRKMSIFLSGPARPVFCRFFTSPLGCVTPQLKAVSLSTLSSQFKRVVAAIGLDPSQYGTHSCRRGFASEAAELGADSRELAAMGNWVVGSSVPDKYVVMTKSRRETLTSFVF
jgi:site-specific recombinase XerD